MTKRSVKYIFAWSVTLVALYFAFGAADWGLLAKHLLSADLSCIVIAICFTSCSYLMRSRRWQYLFSDRSIEYFSAVKVLFLGFFMNNVFPARAGELIRAHFGAKVTNHTRTLVLATIASERLADGLTLSLMFVIFSLGMGGESISSELLMVAYLFLFVALGVGVTLVLRKQVFNLIEKIAQKFKHKFSAYLLDRLLIFINGLAPLFHPSTLAYISLWSVVIWLVELCAYISICYAFGVQLPIEYYVLFLVTVNFSSLIPAAPGGIGVIEAVTSAVLIAVGLDREIALAMVITQHIIQYMVVGIPGAVVMFTWKSEIKDISAHKTQLDPV